ncbi:hypothetical protein QFC22_004750 [Naganishia vaughanmartiniae]|uniref:Uncharacterized protein n=1 Tax=Naganishia vaughanmartiniae TaxID=1424756 RepID=A0ACC2WYU5_9TREE|nr:hypothetical protein QFC22_004750 [Naganishia vaughanmartiniae]
MSLNPFRDHLDEDGGFSPLRRVSSADMSIASHSPIANRSPQGIYSRSPSRNEKEALFASTNEVTDMLNELDDTAEEAWERTVREKEQVSIFSMRGWANMGALAFIALALISLFCILPVTTQVRSDRREQDRVEGGIEGWSYNLGGVNATGQVPAQPRELIDPETPKDVYTRTGFDGKQWSLKFSDEFNTDGRTFFPGDDPFWEAVDLHYHGTNDWEWYDPSAVHTEGGSLIITQTQERINDLNFKSGMLQGWNKVCFYGSMYFEVSVSLPGNNIVGGFWPGIWTFGNLGRAGYTGTTDGVSWLSRQNFTREPHLISFPSKDLAVCRITNTLVTLYTYDSCDTGILPNQTWVNGTGPDAALHRDGEDKALSYLPGMRWNNCLCPGQESEHPGPNITIGRSAPEIDAVEAQIRVKDATGEVSQSFQIAPFNAKYAVPNETHTIFDHDITHLNSYWGSEYQQAVSYLTDVDPQYYVDNSDSKGTFGFELYGNENTRGDNYITWVANGKPSWTLHAESIGPDPLTDIGQRLISEEPMYLIMNFGAY